MKAVEAVCEILKREGIEIVIGYPVNHVLEYAARADIRPVIVRQERVGLHMADAMSRLSRGKTIGICINDGLPYSRVPNISKSNGAQRYGADWAYPMCERCPPCACRPFTLSHFF